MPEKNEEEVKNEEKKAKTRGDPVVELIDSE